MSRRDAPEEGGGFRWSFDEVKLLFRHPFSGQTRASARSNRQNANSTGVRSKGWIGRWSMEDLKNKFKSIRNSSTGKQTEKKRKRPKLTPEEREIRREERMKARREKKSRREKERRENVNELFGQLGNLLQAPTGSTKDKTAALEKAVVIMKDKQKKKKRGKKKKYKAKKGHPHPGPSHNSGSNGMPTHSMNHDPMLNGGDDNLDVVDKFLAMDFETDDGFLSLQDDEVPPLPGASSSGNSKSPKPIVKRKR